MACRTSGDTKKGPKSKILKRICCYIFQQNSNANSVKFQPVGALLFADWRAQKPVASEAAECGVQSGSVQCAPESSVKSAV